MKNIRKKLREQLEGKNMIGVDITRPDQVLDIMRGIPGSGKSTEAENRVGNGVIHSTDNLIEAQGDYKEFFQKMIETGNFGELHKMHTQNLNNAKKSMEMGVSPVIIDNTNIKAWEPKAYVEHALSLGYDDKNINFIDVGDGGQTAEVLAQRNTHGVPLDKIKQMIASHKSVGELTVEKVIDAKMKGGSTNKVSYSAVVLDNKSHDKIVKAFAKHIPKDWKLFAHHMTIIFGRPLKKMGLEGDNGKTVTLNVTHIGKSDMAVAIKVDGYPSKNDIPHVTMAVNTAAGGKPQMSNDITDWRVLESPMRISGVVSEIKHK
jgi:predicted kinase